MPLQPATRLGPYEIISRIGVGGMGEVYKARDTRLARTVAVKVLREHYYGNQQARERFEREARTLSALTHAHVCPLYDVGNDGGVDYLVMEYLDGQTLAERLRKGPLPPDQVLQYAIQITDALDAAHHHGLVHRDLKPENVMLTKSGVKLLDFGLAKTRVTHAVAFGTESPTQSLPQTKEGTILGTLQYMAPEQLEGKEADVRTDIFALGAVVYEMATGRKAFQGKSQASVISAIMTAEPPAISSLQGTPAPLEHVVRTCLAKDPDMRWQTAKDVLLEFKWIENGAVLQGSTPADLRRIRKRERLRGILAGCILGALTFAGAMLYLRSVPEPNVMQFDVMPPHLEPIFSQAITSDGQHIAMTAMDAKGRVNIVVHSLGSFASEVVSGTDNALWVSWSPDGRQLLFGTESSLRKVSISGGPSETVYNSPILGTGAWNREGLILFCPGSDHGLYKVSAMGGPATPVTKLDVSRGETAHVYPSFLPDGRRFLYLAWGIRPENRAAYLGSLDSPSVQRIEQTDTPFRYVAPGYVMYVQRATSGLYSDLASGSGTLMARRFDARRVQFTGDPIRLARPIRSSYGSASISDNGVLTYIPDSTVPLTQLAWFDRSGKRIKNVTDSADYSNPALSPNRDVVAVGKADPETGARDIWLIDLQRSTTSRLTFDPADDLNPTWSPDGERIAFSSNRKGYRDIYVKAANGAGDEQVLIESAEHKSVEDWSGDGEYLVWGSDTTTGYEGLFSFREKKAVPLLQGRFAQDQCRFSPTRRGPPRWIAYRSEETGTSQVYVRSFPGVLSGSGGKWQISTDGGTEPMWRGDGKELFYLNGNKLMTVEVDGTGTSFRAGIPQQLFEAPLVERLRRNRYVVSADGKRFLMQALAERPGFAGVHVVLNWKGLLRR